MPRRKREATMTRIEQYMEECKRKQRRKRIRWAIFIALFVVASLALLWFVSGPPYGTDPYDDWMTP
jgi:hypothetical protein